MKKRATVKDIAKHVGVSPTTVSNVLNKRGGRVSDEIIAQVYEAVELLGYKKNYSALSLVSNRSNLIGVIIPQMEQNQSIMLDNPFYAEFIGELEFKLRAAGYHIILSGATKDDVNLTYLDNWNLDGVILLGAYDASFYHHLKDRDVPIVLVDSYIEDDYFYKVRIDDELGGYLATEYLIEKGHKHIGLVTGSLLKEGVAEKRFMGYKRALKTYNLPFDPTYIFEKEVSFEWGQAVARQLSDQKHTITALFAIADIMATGLISGFHEKGVHIPNDMSIIGFDDVILAKIATPALTTINQNIQQKAATAAKVMLDVLTNQEPKASTELLDIKVVERSSVKEVDHGFGKNKQ